MSILNRIIFLTFFLSCASLSVFASESDSDSDSDDDVISAYEAYKKVPNILENPRDLTLARDAISRGGGTLESYMLVLVHGDKTCSNALWDMAAWIFKGEPVQIEEDGGKIPFGFGEDTGSVLTSLLSRVEGKKPTEEAQEAFDKEFLDAITAAGKEGLAKLLEESFSAKEGKK